jgi:hypothetical protein
VLCILGISTEKNKLTLGTSLSESSFSVLIRQQIPQKFGGYSTILRLTMGFMVAGRAECDQILGNVISESAPRLNVMNLKILHSPAPLATPAISL